MIMLRALVKALSSHVKDEGMVFHPYLHNKSLYFGLIAAQDFPCLPGLPLVKIFGVR